MLDDEVDRALAAGGQPGDQAALALGDDPRGRLDVGIRWSKNAAFRGPVVTGRDGRDTLGPIAEQVEGESAPFRDARRLPCCKHLACRGAVEPRPCLGEW